MANHKEWMELTIIEKIDMVGKLTHLLQNDLSSYNFFKSQIKISELMGKFNEIKINKNELHDNSGN